MTTQGLTKADAWFAARHIWGEVLKLRPDVAQCGLKVYLGSNQWVSARKVNKPAHWFVLDLPYWDVWVELPFEDLCRILNAVAMDLACAASLPTVLAEHAS